MVFQLYANRDPVNRYDTYLDAKAAAEEKYGDIDWSGFRGPHLWVGYAGGLEIEIRKDPVEPIER